LSEAQQIAFWTHNSGFKQAGMMMAFWGGTLYAVYCLAITIAMRRIAGDRGILSTAQIVLGAFSTVFFSCNFLMLAVVPFRNPPWIALADLSFIWTFAPIAPFFFQYIVIAMASFQDRSQNPIFPRWVAYYNIWAAIGYLPACAVPFFHTGPLAWNGVFGFWIPTVLFIAWFFVMFPSLRRAAAEMALEPEHASQAPSTKGVLTPQPIQT
jgi:hypothetical protein